MKRSVSTDAASMTKRWQHPTAAFSDKRPPQKNLMDLNSDPSQTLKNKRATQKQDNLMDLDRSHRKQVCEKFESLQLTKRPTANHTELSL